MQFSNIAKVERIFNAKRKSDTLVILPVYREYDCLTRNLSLLAKQTRKDFDVLVILSSVSDEKRAALLLTRLKTGFTVILTKRQGETGSAGGFFAGQVYALENGYDYMVLADVDCYPVDKQLMESLGKNRGQCVVLPKVRLIGPKKGGPKKYQGTIPNYGMIPSAIVRKIGLVYAPYYNAGEDVDYYQRVLKTGHKFLLLDRFVSHPNGTYKKLPYVLVRPHYILHALIANRPTINIWVHFMGLFEGAVFFAEPFRSMMRRMLRLVLQFKYGKVAADELKIDLKPCILGKNDAPKDAAVLNLGHGWSLVPAIRQGGYRYMLQNIATVPIKYFRKSVLVKETNSYRLLALAAVFAKELYYQTPDGKYILVARNRSSVIHAIKIVAFYALLPFALALSIPMFLLMRRVKLPSTVGYGL